MPQSKNEEQSAVIIEKIKQRPINRRKLLRRTVITVVMAVLFGLVACFTFLLLEPIISKSLYPEEEEPVQMVIFPEDAEEISPEEMLTDLMQQENQNQPPQETAAPGAEKVQLDRQQIDQILSSFRMDIVQYRQLYSALNLYANTQSKCLVTVTGISSNVDWLDTVQESTNQTPGVLIADNGRELLILADYAPLEGAEHLRATFAHGSYAAEARLKMWDADTGLAVLAVENNRQLDNLRQDGTITLASLGTTNVIGIVGTPVIALGSPLGIIGSVGYGMVASCDGMIYQTDANYQLLQTDIAGSASAAGVIFNLQGQVMGIITGRGTDKSLENMVTAYGISDLKARMTKLSNAEPIPYLGISGMDVSEEAYAALGVPYGAYVREMDMDSPAMRAGIQRGDVIVALDGSEIASFRKYTSVLFSLTPGQTVDVTVMRLSQEEYREMQLQIEVGTRE